MNGWASASGGKGAGGISVPATSSHTSRRRCRLNVLAKGLLLRVCALGVKTAREVGTWKTGASWALWHGQYEGAGAREGGGGDGG